MQNEMRLESTGQNYLLCAAMHSTAYFLLCGFLQVFMKTLEERSKTGVSLFTDD